MKANQTFLLFVIVVCFFHYKTKKETFINTLQWKKPSLRFENKIPMMLSKPISQYIYRPGMFSSYLRSDVDDYIQPIINEINNFYKTNFLIGSLLWVKVKYFSNAKEYFIRTTVIDSNIHITQIIELNIIIFNFCNKYHVNYIHFPQTKNTLEKKINLFNESNVIIFNNTAHSDLSIIKPTIIPKIYPSSSIETRYDTMLVYSSRLMKQAWSYVKSIIG